MKNKTLFLFFVFFIFAFSSCKKAEATTENQGSEASYAFGMALGMNLKETGLTIDFDRLNKGIRDMVEGNDLEISIEEAGMQIQQALALAYSKLTEENQQKEVDFLNENGKKKGVISTTSGLQYEVLKEGTGANPKATDTVKVHYTGSLTDGTKFDSSIDRGEPAELPLNGVITGWSEGIQLMKIGGKNRFYIPSNLAYGENGAGGVIEPFSTLIFEVELLDIVK